MKGAWVVVVAVLAVAAAIVWAGSTGASAASRASCHGVAVKVGKRRLCLLDGARCPPARYAAVYKRRGFVCSGGLLRVPARVLATIPVGRGPLDVDFLDGSLWVNNSADGTLSRIDPATNAVTATIPIGEGGGPITAGDGSIWALAAAGTVSRIDPASNAVLARIDVGTDFPAGIAWTPGSIWVANHHHRSGAQPTVERIDTATNRVVSVTGVGTPCCEETGGPFGLTAAFGGLWTNTSLPELVRIDAGDGSVQTFPLSCGGNIEPLGDSLWMSCGSSVRRVDPATRAVRATVAAPAGVGSIYPLASDGAFLWATSSRKLLVKIDPASARILEVRVFNAQGPFGGPAELAVGDGSAWVSDYLANRVLRLQP